MARSRTLRALALSIALSAFASLTSGEQDGNVVAEVGGQKVTRAELEQKQATKLLEARYQHYLAERDALDRVIDDWLLETQARRDQLTVEELLQREVMSQVKNPTEDQLEVFYEGLRTTEPFEITREKILATIRQIRVTKARAAYLESLRRQADIHIALAPPSLDVALDGAPRRGPLDAPVLVVEFADYECPYCRAVHPELEKLKNQFGDKIAFAFKDFPLPMHPNAQKAAEATRCAGAQGRFWDFHDLLFESKNLQVANLKEFARTLGLDQAQFDRCLDSNEQAAAVQADLAQAQRLGLTGTPSFFINGHFLSGAVRYNTLREIVEQQLVKRAASATRALKP